MRCVLRFAEERFPADCLRPEEAVLFAVDFFAAEELRADPLELFFFFEPVLFFDVVFFVFAPMKNQSLIILVLPTYFTLPFPWKVVSFMSRHPLPFQRSDGSEREDLQDPGRIYLR